eukprot:CAMPEP_0204588630 /NCGR_PEP_ID=MMETSP0661-20131031/48730_1 /ASSEMBLY_ACC=CAM_ASM_000606 /TAXON_ID=109239 /ORGANISM="Alexandrium margalefi, Strain AMGDE01CS-322" /LENGTH=115 /DNA_ID=CAMNT_0051598457 /DNA_START=81 /DNA_END=428 /DNA_ORIENTATION=+
MSHSCCIVDSMAPPVTRFEAAVSYDVGASLAGGPAAGAVPAAAGAAGTGAGAGAGAAAGADGALAFVAITTTNSPSLIPASTTLVASCNILPEWMSFCSSAGKSALASAILFFKS